eukprot:4153276-Amphidinium_carterae.1
MNERHQMSKQAGSIYEKSFWCCGGAQSPNKPVPVPEDDADEHDLSSLALGLQEKLSKIIGGESFHEAKSSADFSQRGIQIAEHEWHSNTKVRGSLGFAEFL